MVIYLVNIVECLVIFEKMFFNFEKIVYKFPFHELL